jgi:hypothetical protein
MTPRWPLVNAFVLGYCGGLVAQWLVVLAGYRLADSVVFAIGLFAAADHHAKHHGPVPDAERWPLALAFTGAAAVFMTVSVAAEVIRGRFALDGVVVGMLLFVWTLDLVAARFAFPWLTDRQVAAYEAAADKQA